MPSKRLVSLVLLLVPALSNVFGQPGDPGEPVPIPGVLLIFLAGLILGVFKLNKRKSN